MKKYLINGEEVSLDDISLKDGEINFSIEGESFTFKVVAKSGAELILQGQERFRAFTGIKNTDGEAMVLSHGVEAIVSEAQRKSKKKARALGSLTSPMPGKIFKVMKEEGSIVKQGDTILILEAMKMEHSIRADKDGTVKKIFFKPGELVQGGVTLAEVE
jgi:biotin carboxyl carrier protein